jgi:hypothetical protein
MVMSLHVCIVDVCIMTRTRQSLADIGWVAITGADSDDRGTVQRANSQ